VFVSQTSFAKLHKKKKITKKIINATLKQLKTLNPLPPNGTTVCPTGLGPRWPVSLCSRSPGGWFHKYIIGLGVKFRHFFFQAFSYLGQPASQPTVWIVIQVTNYGTNSLPYRTCRVPRLGPPHGTLLTVENFHQKKIQIHCWQQPLWVTWCHTSVGL
jgi:hypothetical protein